MTHESLSEPTLRRSAMHELKSGTADLHRHLETRLKVAERFTQRELYVAHLARLAAFHVCAEESWSAFLQPVLSDFSTRRKSPLLLRDLALLGGSMQTTGEVPVLDSSAAALGAFYVLEGATLGGRHLSVIVERRLGLDAEHGAAYLASYGPNVSVMWERFGAAVEAHCSDQESIVRAVAAARATFLALEQWLCGALP